eukprot:2336268-Amphidinium_carterae.1
MAFGASRCEVRNATVSSTPAIAALVGDRVGYAAASLGSMWLAMASPCAGSQYLQSADCDVCQLFWAGLGYGMAGERAAPQNRAGRCSPQKQITVPTITIT